MTEQPNLQREFYEVRTVPLAVCGDMVRRYHYAGAGANTATFRHGLFLREQPAHCLGIAWWIPPTRSAAAASWDGDWRQVLSLSRLVIEPDVPTNACSFLIARSVRLIREHGFYRCLVTYADTWQGHSGNIYRAANWEYLGETAAEETFLSLEGSLVARKAGPKTRTRAEMATLGHRAVGRFSKHKFRLIIEPIPPRHRAHQPALLEEASHA